ncbi:MAG: 50S ribosomal protein L13 [Sandaracinaceae bacterium]|nr:50S ribosomal protein L13 [Sandaracinaceae bacterium]
MSTPAVQPKDIERRWHVVDASGQSLGRLASTVARILRGKHRPSFTPSTDTGDFVVVVNAEKVRLTGNKANSKFYSTHSGVPGGIHSEPYRLLLLRRPEIAIEKAVFGMLPKNCLGRRVRSKLKVYAGPTHPHAAQKPQPLAV